MEMMEKVERLREKANVSYEEAKDALEQAGGDLLDAIVLLERQGKVRGPAQSTFSTDYEEQTEFVKVRDKVEEQENSAPSFGRTFGRLFRGFWEILAPVMVIALFFGIRYLFEGEEEAQKANSILNKAGDFAQDVRSEFTKKDSDTDEM